MFPFLLRGSEEHLLEYILEEDTVSTDFLELLAKAGHCISFKLRLVGLTLLLFVGVKAF